MVTTGSELEGPPSDDQDGTSSEDSSATKRKARKMTKQAVKEKKVKKTKLLQAQKEEEERLWEELTWSTQEDGSNQTFIRACAETKNQAKKARQTQGNGTKRVESSDSSGDYGYPVESETDDDGEGSQPSTNDEESDGTEPATKKAKRRITQSDEGQVWLIVIGEDQHFTVIREVTVSQEEYTPSHPMIGKLVAVAGEPVNEKEAPQLVVFEEENPWSPVRVPRVDARNVTEHYLTCDDMPEVDQMIANENDPDWSLFRRICIPTHWTKYFLPWLKFEAAMPLLEELLQKEIKANWPGYQSFCAWVATACCKDNVSDTSILAIEARLLRRTAKVKEEARRLWNVFQDAEAKMANMKKRQQKPSKEKVRAAVPITAGSRRVKPTRSKRPRPAAVTPQKKRKPSERESRTVSSDPSSESSSSSDSSSSSSDDSDDNDDSSDTSDSSASSIQPKKKKKHGKITRPRTSHSKTKSLIAMMMRGNRKNLKIALKARDDAMAATGSPASKMSMSRQVALEAMTGHHNGQIPFVPPKIYTDLEAAGWTKEAIQNLQRRHCKGVKGSMH